MTQPAAPASRSRLTLLSPSDVHSKELLWPYVREFADNALAHVAATMGRLAAAGEACELYDIHGAWGAAHPEV